MDELLASATTSKTSSRKTRHESTLVEDNSLEPSAKLPRNQEVIVVDLCENPWVKDIPKSHRDRKVNEILKFGHILMNMAEISANPGQAILDPIVKQIQESICNSVQTKESVSNGIKQMVNGMQSLESSVNKLTGNLNKSVIKGRHGELRVKQVISQHFPDANVDTTSFISRSGDFRVSFPNGPTVLIEVKDYTNTVPTMEVDKFCRDMDATGLNFGIMVSISSGISCKTRFQYERYKDTKHLVFLGKSGHEPLSVVSALLLLNELDIIMKRTKQFVKLDKQDVLKLHEAIDETEKILEYFARTKSNHSRIINEVRTKLQKAEEEVGSLGENIKITIKLVQERIHKKLEDIMSQINNETDSPTF